MGWLGREEGTFLVVLRDGSEHIEDVEMVSDVNHHLQFGEQRLHLLTIIQI